jgi:hypothetical protein
MAEYNNKTTRVCFLSGNVTRVVGFLGRETHKTTGRVGFPGPENHECDISTQKTHECRFLFITCH